LDASAVSSAPVVVGLAHRLQESKFLVFIVAVKSSQTLDAAS